MAESREERFQRGYQNPAEEIERERKRRLLAEQQQTPPAPISEEQRARQAAQAQKCRPSQFVFCGPGTQ